MQHLFLFPILCVYFYFWLKSNNNNNTTTQGSSCKCNNNTNECHTIINSFCKVLGWWMVSESDYTFLLLCNLLQYLPTSHSLWFCHCFFYTVIHIPSSVSNSRSFFCCFLMFNATRWINWNGFVICWWRREQFLLMNLYSLIFMKRIEESFFYLVSLYSFWEHLEEMTASSHRQKIWFKKYKRLNKNHVKYERKGWNPQTNNFDCFLFRDFGVEHNLKTIHCLGYKGYIEIILYSP